MKHSLKILYALLLFQFLYRSALFIQSAPGSTTFGPKIAGFPGFLLNQYLDIHSDIGITIPIVVILVYIIWKLLLGLSYQKQSTSGREALFFSSLFIYEFLCLVEGLFGIYLSLRKV
jgi:hypothetical protein